MGDEPIIIEQFFYGFEGAIMGSIMGSQNTMGSIVGSQNIMGLDYGSNISGVYLTWVGGKGSNNYQ